MKTIQFVTAIHGNEVMPVLALASMGVPQIVANPRASARGVRYTERDMNASFGTSGESYEERRGREVIELLDPTKAVIDLHSFSVDSPPFAIIVDLEMLPLALSTGLKHVVYMKHNIKGGRALINHCRGVSIEVGRHEDPNSFAETVRIVKRLEKPKQIQTKARIYEVYGRIEEKGEMTNFVEYEGMVPILYGERAYDSLGFYGLKAREITGTIHKEENL